jgi:O-antigen/teichoic acid export membrane protein
LAAGSVGGLAAIGALPEPYGAPAALALAYAAANAFSEIGLAALQVQRRAGAFAAASMLRAVVGVAATAGAAAATGAYGPTVLAGAAAPFVAGLLALALVARRAGVAAPDRAALRAFAAYGAPLGVARSESLVVNSAAQIVLATLVGPAASGAYAAAHTLTVRTTALLMQTLTSTWAPRVYRVHETGSRQDVVQQIRSLVSYLTLIGAPPTIAFAMARDPVTAIVFGPSTGAAVAPFLPYLAVAAFVAGLQHALVGLPFSLGMRTGLELRLKVVNMAVYAAMCHGFVTAFGPMGAGYAIVATACVGFAINGAFAWSFYPSPPPVLDVARLAPAALLSAPVAAFAAEAGDPIRVAGALAGSAVVLVVALAVIGHGATRECLGRVFRRSPRKP